MSDSSEYRAAQHPAPDPQDPPPGDSVEMEPVNRREVHGPALNHQFFLNWLRDKAPKNRLFSYFCVTNVNIPPLSGFFEELEVPAMVMLAGVGKYLYLGWDQIDHDSLLAYTMIELMGPFLPPYRVPNVDFCRYGLMRYVQALIRFKRLGSCTSATRNTYIDEYEKTEMPLAEYVRDATPLPEMKPQPEDWTTTNEVPTPEAAVRILYHLARQAVGLFLQDGMGIIVNSAVALATRGTISMDLSKKIEQDIHNELGGNVVINANSIKLFYDVISNFMTDQNVRELFYKWRYLIAFYSPSLELILNRAAGSGLATFRTIGKAIRKYDTFDWNYIYAMFPEEWENYKAAVLAVNGDPYYGFRGDLSVLCPKKFRCLAYAAKELVINVADDDDALARYRGCANNLPFKAKINEMILHYYRGFRNAEATEDMARAQELRDLINDERNGPLFQ